MTVAVLVRARSSDGVSSVDGRDRLLGEARDRLTGLGVDVADVVDDAPGPALDRVADVLQSAHEPVLLLAAELLLPGDALADLLEDPRLGSATLVGTAGTGEPDLVVRRGRVVDAGSPQHHVEEPDAVGTGAVLVGRSDLAAAAGALRDLAAVARSRSWEGDVLAYAQVALARGAVVVRGVSVDGWPWARPRDEAAATAVRDLVAATDVAAVRLGRALRTDDGFYSTFALRRVSNRLTPWAARRGLSPNSITMTSFVVGLLAALAFAVGSRPWLVAGAVLLQASLVVDCVDGEVARLTRRFTPFGAWLDASTDRVKEFAAYAGLAAGAVRADDDRVVWGMAVAMLVLQTTRHMSDYTFVHALVQREATPRRRPMEDGSSEGATATAPQGGAARAVAASQQANRRAPVMWAKRVVHMPIGERWLVLSLGAALGGPRWALGPLLVLGAVALAYTTAGRVTRSLAWRRTETPEAPAVSAQLDRGPLLSRVRTDRPVPTGRLAWSLPALLRLTELGLVGAVATAVLGDARASTFAVLFVVAYHHYDVLYRALDGHRLPDAVRLAGLGVEGRLLVVLVAALLGSAVLEVVLVALAAWLVLVFGLLATGQWLRSLDHADLEAAHA